MKTRLKRCFFLTLFSLAALGAVGLFPSQTEAQPPCTPASQLLALRVFYSSTGGPTWTINEGWADHAPDSPVNAMQLGTDMATQTGNCTVQTLAANVTVPDHCCWYGVSCCSPETCVGAGPSCNCTLGLVTTLSLGGNNVSLLLNACSLFGGLLSKKTYVFPTSLVLPFSSMAEASCKALFQARLLHCFWRTHWGAT